MAIKVKAVERKLKFTKNENDPGVYRYVLGAELYVTVCLAPCDVALCDAKHKSTVASRQCFHFYHLPLIFTETRAPGSGGA